jgi:hypothetical protein
MNKKLLKVPWKAKACKCGSCTMIIPRKKIIEDYVDTDDRTIYEYKIDCVVPYGFLSRELAEYFVELHNRSLKENAK